MSSRPRSRERTQLPTSVTGRVSANPVSALEENVQVIKRWERAILLARSKGQQLSDWIACTAGSGPVLLLHVVSFAGWVGVNVGAIRGISPFDRHQEKVVAKKSQGRAKKRSRPAAKRDLLRRPTSAFAAGCFFFAMQPRRATGTPAINAGCDMPQVVRFGFRS